MDTREERVLAHQKRVEAEKAQEHDNDLGLHIKILQGKHPEFQESIQEIQDTLPHLRNAMGVKARIMSRKLGIYGKIDVELEKARNRVNTLLERKSRAEAVLDPELQNYSAVVKEYRQKMRDILKKMRTIAGDLCFDDMIPELLHLCPELKSREDSQNVPIPREWFDEDELKTWAQWKRFLRVNGIKVTDDTTSHDKNDLLTGPQARAALRNCKRRRHRNV